MTWCAWAEVVDVSDGEVVALAIAGKKVRPYANNYAGTEYEAAETDALTFNTEGELLAVEIRFEFFEEEPPLKVGDLISVNGHFQRSS